MRRLISEGGYAYIFEATDLQNKRRVAIKKMLLDVLHELHSRQSVLNHLKINARFMYISSYSGKIEKLKTHC